MYTLCQTIIRKCDTLQTIFMALTEWWLLIATVHSVICVCLTLCSLSLSPFYTCEQGSTWVFNSSFLHLFIFVCLSQYLSWGLNVLKISLLKWKCLCLNKCKDRKSLHVFSISQETNEGWGEEMFLKKSWNNI